MSFSARRISEELASNKGKKIIIVTAVKDEDEPYIVTNAKTSQPGKHGSAKTALRLKHYFTHRVSEIIVGATQKLDSMKEHALYSVGTGIVLNYDPHNKVVEIADLDQQILSLPCETLPETSEIQYESWDRKYFRIKESA